MKKFGKILLILLAFVSSTSAVKMDITDCGTEGIIYYLDLYGCDNDYEGAEPPASEKCIVSRGGYLYGDSQFEAGFDAEYLDCEIFAFVDGVVSFFKIFVYASFSLRIDHA